MISSFPLGVTHLLSVTTTVVAPPSFSPPVVTSQTIATQSYFNATLTLSVPQQNSNAITLLSAKVVGAQASTISLIFINHNVPDLQAQVDTFGKCRPAPPPPSGLISFFCGTSCL